MTNDQLHRLSAILIIMGLWLIAFWAYLDCRRRTFTWKWQRFPRFKLEFELIPRCCLHWGTTDRPDKPYRTFALSLACGWAVWAWHGVWMVKTPRPWREATIFKDNPGAIAAVEDKLDRAHERRTKKATNRALDRLKSQGVLKVLLLVGLVAFATGCEMDPKLKARMTPEVVTMIIIWGIWAVITIPTLCSMVFRYRRYKAKRDSLRIERRKP